MTRTDEARVGEGLRLAHTLEGLPGLAGSTLLGYGRVAVILDVPALLHQTLEAASSAAAA